MIRYIIKILIYSILIYSFLNYNKKPFSIYLSKKKKNDGTVLLGNARILANIDNERFLYTPNYTKIRNYNKINNYTKIIEKNSYNGKNAVQRVAKTVNGGYNNKYIKEKITKEGVVKYVHMQPDLVKPNMNDGLGMKMHECEDKKHVLKESKIPTNHKHSAPEIDPLKKQSQIALNNRHTQDNMSESYNDYTLAKLNSQHTLGDKNNNALKNELIKEIRSYLLKNKNEFNKYTDLEVLDALKVILSNSQFNKIPPNDIDIMLYYALCEHPRVHRSIPHYHDEALKDRNKLNRNNIRKETMVEHNKVGNNIMQLQANRRRKNLQHKVMVDKNNLQHKVMVDKNNLQHKVMVDKNNLQHKVLMDKNNLQHKVMVDKNNLQHKVLMDKNNLQHKVMVDKNNLQHKVMVDKNHLPNQNLVDKNNLQHKVIVDKNHLPNKNLVDKNNLQHKVIVDKNHLPNKNLVDKNNLQHKVIVDKNHLPNKNLVDKNNLQHKVIVDKNHLPNKNLVDKNNLQHKVIVDKNHLPNKNLMDKNHLMNKNLANKNHLPNKKLVDRNRLTNKNLVERKNSAQELVGKKRINDNRSTTIRYRFDNKKELSSNYDLIKKQNIIKIKNELNKVNNPIEKSAKKENETLHEYKHPINTGIKNDELKAVNKVSDLYDNTKNDPSKKKERGVELYMEDKKGEKQQPKKKETVIEIYMDNKKEDQQQSKKKETIIKIYMDNKKEEQQQPKKKEKVIEIYMENKKKELENKIESIKISDTNRKYDLSNKGGFENPNNIKLGMNISNNIGNDDDLLERKKKSLVQLNVNDKKDIIRPQSENVKVLDISPINKKKKNNNKKKNFDENDFIDLFDNDDEESLLTEVQDNNKLDVSLMDEVYDETERLLFEKIIGQKRVKGKYYKVKKYLKIFGLYILPIIGATVSMSLMGLQISNIMGADILNGSLIAAGKTTIVEGTQCLANAATDVMQGITNDVLPSINFSNFSFDNLFSSIMDAIESTTMVGMKTASNTLACVSDNMVSKAISVATTCGISMACSQIFYPLGIAVNIAFLIYTITKIIVKLDDMGKFDKFHKFRKKLINKLKRKFNTKEKGKITNNSYYTTSL
ncbi:Plasmodium exported protein, unknown function [Plasmodium vinckei lentum]|uniref:Uncharacterized protein n=1 Tax=Plasmodium vinckei lentum TaxID=138297 RepID=A0A6V7RXT3_PLAVN|nr:Plasmodium exported protein, unknown function [Plasmodium vinckei lentum]